MNLLEEELKRTPIHKLREIGRAYGVKSPTSLTKDKLISAILDIKNGKTQPYKSNRGRPILVTTKDIIPPKILALERLRKIQELITDCENEILKIILDPKNE